MRGPYLTITCPNEECEAQIEVETEAEPDDPSYGSDADGNRGIFVAGGIEGWSTPEKCPTCGVVYDKDQLEQIDDDLRGKAESWEPDEPVFDESDDYMDRDYD